MSCVLESSREKEIHISVSLASLCNKSGHRMPGMKSSRIMVGPRKHRTAPLSSVHDLHMAIVANHLPMVSKILESFEGDVNGKVKGATALAVSLYKNRHDIFCRLMEFHHTTGLLDLDRTSRDHLGRHEPPVVTAARLRFFPGVHNLLESGADINGMDNFGHTALWFAVHHRLTNASRQLIMEGANVSKTDAYNFTPLYLALNLHLESNLIYLLIYCGSNMFNPSLNYAVGPDKSLLSLAVQYGSQELLELLIDLGVGHLNHGTTISDKLLRAGVSNGGDAFSKTVWQFCSNPLPLQNICRLLVRSKVSCHSNGTGKAFVESLLRLPLPNDLKCYLVLPELHKQFQGILQMKSDLVPNLSIETAFQ